MTMQLYLIDVQMKGSRHRFGLSIDGDSPYVSEGEWPVQHPGQLYLRQSSGYWRMRSDSIRIRDISLYDKDDPSAVSVLFWGSSLMKLLGVLWVDESILLSLKQQGIGVMWGSDHNFTWEVVYRYF